ncbi:hypothetical protein C8R45DRAFT_938744 [Mycena sanguinolenta]|nr:hypothetical protein C8R45DRAFT_938744 [Mycena sanguinolenta]
MTNWIQLVPAPVTPPTPLATQYFAQGSFNPLVISPTNPTSAPAVTEPTPTPASQPTPTPTASQGTPIPAPPSQAPCADVAALDSQLPMRATCPMPYHPDIGIDRMEHSDNAACKFYVACPARIQGVYNTCQRADEQVRGYRNWRAIAVHVWGDAEAEWRLACLRWHGPSCPNVRPPVTMSTCIHLHPALRTTSDQWAVQGILKLFATREEAFAGAVTHNFREIHMLCCSDEARLWAWADRANK